MLGVVGGGQLGRMLALAAARLGFDTAVLGCEAAAPAARVAASEVTGAYDDLSALHALAARCDALTFEFENVSADAVEALERDGLRVAPGALALRTAQDRAAEKAFLNAHGCPTAAYAEIDSAADLAPALERLGAPALLKTRREGYDGKGQAWIGSVEEGAEAFTKLGARPACWKRGSLSYANSPSWPRAGGTAPSPPTPWRRTATRTACCAAPTRRRRLA